ncbi:hypothetical protein C5K05_23120 [Shigella flexneri]|nr:hypothetical protein C5K05_23120 [Shigella flexneri]
MSLIDAQYFWFGHEKVTYSMLEQTNFAFSVQEFEGKVVSVLRSVLMNPLMIFIKIIKLR